MFAVLVHFEIHPDQFAAFQKAIEANARTSLKDEPGCHRFDVAYDGTKPHAAMLYELYDTAAAFETHKASAHYAAFQSKTSKMVRSKSVETWDWVQT